MAKHTFELLAAHVGQQASCSGATQIRAGVIRPEIVIPRPGPEETSDNTAPTRDRPVTTTIGIQIGDLLRIIREPYFGIFVRVKALPPVPQRIATESIVRVLVATLPNGQEITIPRANVEMIEG